MFEGLFQPMHLLVVLGVAMLVLGPKRLPELGSGLGKGIKEFKRAIGEIAKDPKSDSHEDDTERRT